MEIHPILTALMRSKTGAVVVAAQVALTLAIVCNALFVVDARLDTASRPSGVAEDEVFRMHMIGAKQIDDPAAVLQKDLETLRAIPDVVSVAHVNSLPMTTSGSYSGVSGDPTKPDGGISAAVYYSGDSIIETLGLRLVEGRDFEPAEVRVVEARKGQPIADTVILSRQLAKKLLPGEPSVVGKTVYFGTGDGAQPMKVVGVVETLMDSQGQTEQAAYDSFIMPVRYIGNAAQYAVRTRPGQRSRVMRDAERLLPALRNDRVMINLQGIDQVRERRYRHERGGAKMLIAVTIGLLLVTASGIVGVASLWVTQRRKQIGVRRALGARRSDIIRYFVTENLLITTGGVIAGVAMAIGLNQYLVSKVELARLPVTYIGAGMLAAWVLGFIAVLGPAWRAASVPPATATRSA